MWNLTEVLFSNDETMLAHLSNPREPGHRWRTVVRPRRWSVFPTTGSPPVHSLNVVSPLSSMRAHPRSTVPSAYPSSWAGWVAHARLRLDGLDLPHLVHITKKPFSFSYFSFSLLHMY
jgi:hypothetical protein